MGIQEERAKKIRSKTKLQEAILASVSIVGLMSMAILAPNAVKYLKTFGIDPSSRYKEVIKRSRNRLVRRGLLTYKDGFLKITNRGESELRRMKIRNTKLSKPKKWDERWRVLIFDIPEKKRSLREKVRNTLIDIGFLKLQDSVWIYPYECEDLVILLKADLKIGKDLLYLVVESVENDKNFRLAFKLPHRL